MRKTLLSFILLPLGSLVALTGMGYNPMSRDMSGQPGTFLHQPADDPKCTDCHGALLEKKKVHPPAQEGCEKCHGIKAADHPGKVAKGLFLTEQVPGLCIKCHEGVKQDIDTARNVHMALKEKGQCLNCHSPHSSDEKKLLKANGREVCLQCHDKEMNINGRKTSNIKQLLATSKVLHPALKGGCSPCHKSHASNENYLLISAFPSESYAPGKKDNFAICWECHDSDLLELATTTTSTGFRDGERNLHYVHLKGNKGRSCIMCHDVHATTNLHLVVDNVPFGEWKLQLNYVPSDSGGTCAPGCHRPVKYTR